MSYIRTDSNRNPVGTANILSDSIIVHNYQAVDSLITNSTQTLNSLTQSNLNVISTIYNDNSTTSGLKAKNVFMDTLNVNGSGNSMIVGNINGSNLSLITLDNQDGNVSNVLNLNMRNLNVSSYLYANKFVSESINIENGSGTFNKNINVNGALNANVLNNSNLNITQLENSNQVTFAEGNVTNNLNAPDLYTNGTSIVNNQITMTNDVNMTQNTFITRLDASDLYSVEKRNSSTISQNNVNNTSLALIGPSSVTFSGSADITENTSGNNKIVRRNADIINAVFESNLDVTALLGTVNGISLLNSNVVNVTDTLYVTSEYNHTTNDINTNGNLIVTTRNFIAPTATISNEANVSRRIFNSDTISANVVEPTIFYINESARVGNINAGAVTAGSYNALRRITTTGNVESNVLTSNGLRGTGEFIFNSQVDINTLQTVDLNLNNTTISYLSSNSEGGNIDLGNLNSYITSNIITGYSTANIIAGNVVQDIVVGNVLANVKVGEIVTGNIYLGNILTEIIVSNSTANLIVGNLSTFITIGNTVSNVVVGNISSNVFIGNLEVIGIVGNVSSNIISGNLSSNVISGYIESNIIVGNIESQVLVGQTTTQVIDGYTIEQIITGNTTANVIVGSYQENVFIGNSVANLVVGNVTANVISGYELANLIIGNVYANIVVGNVLANIVVGNILGNIVIGNIEQSVVVGNTVGNGIVGNVYANIIVGNVESSNVIIGNTVIPNVVIGNITTENVVIGNIITTGVVGNTITTGVNGNIVGAGNANLNIGNLALSSVTIDQISIPNIWSELNSGNLSGNIVTNKNVGNVILTYSTASGNIAASSFLPAYNNTQPLTTIAWSPELSLFVAGAQNGNNNRFLTSPDGINWTNRTSTANSNWFGSCWSKELSLFAMVGGGCCATSPDGINWTARTIPSGEWSDICWSKELSLFVAVAWSAASTNLAVMTSPDGVTWTGRTTPNNFQWNSVTWSPSLSLFVAVAGGAVNGAGTNTNVMTSPNGTTWTLRTTNLQKRWYGVAWSPTLSMFVAVARTGSTSSIMSSTDGINWTSRTSPNMTFNNIIWVSEHSMFIVSTSGASSIAIFSKDGINWNTINNGTGDIGDYYDLAWAPSLGRLCLVNNNATNKVAYATTTASTTITSGNVIETNYFLGNIISSNILIGNIVTENVVIGNVTANVVVGNANVYGIIGNIITTGITGNITSNVSANVYDPSNISYNDIFNTYTSITTTQKWNDIIEGSNILVAIGEITTTGNSSALVATSTDAKTWTTRTTPSNNRWRSITWSSSLNLFVACAEFTARTNNIMTSPDGISWTARTTPVSDVWYVVKWSPELNIFVALSRTRAIVSSNGTTWTSYTITTPSNPFVIEWSPTLNMFVVVFSSTSAVLTSSNGTTWTTTNVSNVSISSPRSIIWSTKFQKFCLLCANNLAFTSPDGINWTSQTLPIIPGVSTTYYVMEGITWSPKHNLFFLQSGSNATSTKYYMTSPDFIIWNYYLIPITNGIDYTFGETNIQYVNFLNTVVSLSKNYTSNVINTFYLEDNLTTFSYPTCTASLWRSVCWSSELLQFVAVATTGTTSSIMTSTNGTTWTNRTSPNTNNYEGVCWSPKLGLYCAVATSGTGNRVSTSPDGITWIARTTPADNSWNFVCWSEEVSLFVAVSSTGTATGRVMTSSDGITWTLRNAYSGGNWTSVCWAKERSIFIAISPNGLYMTSPDGITWTGGSLPPSLAWESIIWSPELSIFVMVAYTASTNNIATSPDGINWTLRTSPISVQWGSVIWASDIKRFFACTDPPTSSNNMITSTDGITWTTIPLSYGKFVRMCWAPEIGKLCAVSNSLGVVLTHTNSNFSDGRNFRLVGSTLSYKDIDAYEWSGNLMVGLGNSLTNGIITSTDGYNYTSKSTLNKSLTDYTWNAIAWSPTLNIYCAVGDTTGTNGFNTIMISSNGINWERVDVTFTIRDWECIIWSPELSKFVAGGVNAMMISSDGINWTYITSGISNRTWSSIAWSSSLNLLCAVANTSGTTSIATSPDGITWTLRTTPISDRFTSIDWSPELSLFCAKGGLRSVFTSPDGINWTKHILYNINDGFDRIKWVSEVSKFYGTSMSNQLIYTSSDGINWDQTNILSSNSYDAINSIDWSPTLGKIYAVGNNKIPGFSYGNVLVVTNTNSMLSGNTYTPNNISGNVFSYSYNSPSSNINFTSITRSIKTKLFCAVASSGTTSSIMTSPDGVTWITRTAPNTNNLTSVCFAEELGTFVAVASSGSGNRVNTSSNGTSWTSRTSAANNRWSSVCWSPSLSLFVAVATNVSPVNAAQLVMTSPDDVTWTIRNSYNGGSWSSVCWSQQLSLFVAVSLIGGHVMTSPDGITWTRYAAASSNAWTSVTWSRELSLFVAVANSGTGDRVMTSSDGMTWISRTSAADYAWSSLTWASELNRFFVVSSDTNNFMMTSTNGIDWSLIQTTSNTYSSICYAFDIGQICAVSSLTTTLNKVLTFSSPVLADYRNFTRINTLNTIGIMNSISWSPSLNTFIGIGDTVNKSVNLIQDSYANISGNSLITTSTYDYLNNDWKSVVYSASLNLYVAVASSGTKNRIMTSSDGTIWIARTSPADNNWEKVIWANELGLFVAVASSGNSNRIMTSPNGITWTLRTTSNNNWKSVAWAPSIPLLCAVGTLLYTKPATLYNTTSNKIASIANDMTPLANGTAVTSFGSYALSTYTSPLIQYYSSGGYKNKPFIQFKGVTPGEDILNISSLALNMSTNGGFTLVTKVYIAEGRETRTRYPIWQTNNALNYGTNLIGLYYFSPSQVGSSNGYFSFQIYNGGTSSSTGTLICTANTTSIFALNNWYTITVTVAAANGSAAEIYVDDVLAGSANISAALTNRTNIYNFIGQDTANAQFRFLGLYDSIFVYDRKLNSTELQSIYDYIEGTSGDNNSVITSPDGVTWTSRSTNYDSNNISSITWSPKLSMFVAVGNNHLGNRIIRSTNGTTWTPCNVNYDYQNWKTVVWVEDLGMFYATTTDNSYDNAILTSYDGINWLLTYPPTDDRYSWKDFVWAKSLNRLFVFGNDGINGAPAILSHTNQIEYTISNVTTTTPVYGNITVPQYGNVSTPVYGNVLVPQYGNVNTPVYANIITSIYGNVVIPTYSSSNSALYGNIYFPSTLNSSNITISSNIISSNFNLTLPLYGNILTPTIGNISTPIYGNISTPQYGNITTAVYGNILIPQYGVIVESIYANVLVPVYGNITIPTYGNVITPVYGQAYLPVYGNVLVPQYGNVLVPEYGFVQLPIYEEVTTPVYGNVIIPIYETQDFPIYEEQTIPVYTAVPTPIYSNIVEDVFETVYTPIYNTSNVPIYQTIITPIYKELITPIYGTIYLPQYEEILTPIIEERVTPIYEEVLTPIYQEMIIPQTTYVYTPVYQDIIEPVYDNVLQPVYGKALLPVYTEIQIPIYSEVLVYVDPTAKTSSTNDLFTGSATVTNLLSFANGTTNNLFSSDSLYAPNLTLAANPYTLNTGNMECGNINAGNLIINPNFNARNSIITDRGLTSFRNTVFSSDLVVGNISVNRNYISFTSNQDFKPSNISVSQSLFATSVTSQTSNVTIQNISTLNGSSMIHIKDSNSESNIRDNIINTTYLTSNNSVTAIDVTISESATTQNINVSNETLTSGNIYGKNFNNSSNLSAENVIATDNMFISSNVSGTFTMPRTDAGNLTIKDTVRNNHIKSSSLQDILDLYVGNISTSKLYTSIDALRSVLYKDNADNLFLGDNVVGNIYIGGPQQITQTIYIGSALDTIYIGGDLSNILSSDVNVKDAAIVINNNGTSYNNAGVQFEENSVIVGSLLLNSSGQFVFSDATGNVYSLTHIADGNFENMNVTNNVLSTSHIISGNVLVQNSLSGTILNTETYENSSNINTSNVNSSAMITNSLLSTTMTSNHMNVFNNSTINGNVTISNTLQTFTFDAVDLTSSNINNSSNINSTDLSFTTLSGVNASITNNANVENINTHEIILNAGNVTTTNTIITKNILLDNGNVTTHDANYDFRINGPTHYGIESKLDTNKFGIMNITTGNSNPEPSLSLVRKNNYVWNMGYDNNSNDFVIYDGNVGVRLTASNSQSWSSVSDERYKKDIETIDEMEAMNKVMNGRGVYYNYLSDKEDAQRKVGFIAQEINEILPEVVDIPENQEDALSVRYQEVYPLLVQALKGAAKELKELKEKMKSKKM